MRLSREALRQRSDFVGAPPRADRRRRAWPDRTMSRRPRLQELRRAQPNISLAWIADHMPIQHDADREHYLEGFRRAGLA